MSIVYALIRRDRDHRGLVMVSTDRGVVSDTAEDLAAAMPAQEFSVVPVTLAGMARFWPYRRMFDRARAELQRIGTIA